jgi:hypothetical protein
VKNQQYDNYQVASLGVNLASKLLAIDPPEISFIAQSFLSNPTITAMYLQETKEIIFNEDWVIQANWLEVIATSFHECRHAYQHHCVETSSREDKATREKWAKELSCYFQPSDDKPQEHDVDYLQQSIEIDSIAFTQIQIQSYFHAITVIPEKIITQVNDRVMVLRKENQ